MAPKIAWRIFWIVALTRKVTSFRRPLLIGMSPRSPESQKAGMAVLVLFSSPDWCC